MARKTFHWDEATDPDGNVQHIARHRVTVEEAESVVLDNRNNTERSRSSSYMMTFGSTRSGKYIAVVWSAVGAEPLVITVITAYEVERPEDRSKAGPGGGRS